MRHTALSIVAGLVCGGAAACNRDSVQPAFTDPYAAITGVGLTGSGGATAPISGSPGAAGTGLIGALGTGTIGTGGNAPTSPPGNGTTAVPSTGTIGTGGAAMQNTAGIIAAGTGGAGMSPPSGGACDITGRWLVTIHTVTETLGQEQTAHVFAYYEIARDGNNYKVSKGLHCGDDAASTGDLAVMVDFTAAWPSERTKISYAGRAVTSNPSASGCDLHFAKMYTVRGATLPYYLDPANALPTVDQKASGSTPGWEDWDGDGQPGITGLLSGPGATGKIFVAPRIWTELTGSVSNTMASFRLPVDWDQEQNVMAYDPDWNVTLGTPSSRHPDNSLHFSEFVRLADGQATGDDNAICDAVVKLAPTLTPEASAI